MKTYTKHLLLSSISLLVANTCIARWVYSHEFGTDIWKEHNEEVEFVNCNTGVREMMSVGICMRRDGQGGFENATLLTDLDKTLKGLPGKVAAGVEAARPKRSGSLSSSFSASSLSEARRTGKNYNYNTSKQHQAWLDDKRSREKEEQARKREEAIQRKIADDNRAAAVTAAANVALQPQTDRRIQRDRYNATTGAYLAQERVRQAHQVTGPKFRKPQSTGSQRANTLRGQNKPRRVMYPKAVPRNMARPLLTQVKRTTSQTKPKMMGSKPKEFVLSDKAVSTLGKDWKSDALGPQPLAPPPITRKITYKEPDWLSKHKDMLEILGEPPLTPDEELRMLKDHEFLEE